MEDPKLTKVKKFYFRKKRLPSFREMKKIFGYASPSAVAYVVHKWRQSGIVDIDGQKVVPAEQFFSLPLLGVVRAGSPASEDYYETESVSLDEYLVGNPGFAYLLRVSGDSMTGAGIQDGDLVILDRKREPTESDIVAAYVDNAWTLKYFKRKKGKVILEAANPKYGPIEPRQELTIGGVVVSVIRKYY